MNKFIGVYMIDLTNFILGFLSTCGAFMLSLLIVVGGKMLVISFRESLPKKPTQPTQQAPKKVKVIKRRKKPVAPIPKPIRSIEIDPEQIDKIYVKKSS